MRPYLEAATEPGVVAIGVAQEFQSVFCGYKRKTDKPGAVCYGFEKADRRVTVYYFYVVDAEFGPGFMQAVQLLSVPGQGVGQRARVGQTPGHQGGSGVHRARQRVAACQDPEALQAICDGLGPADIQAFFDRWVAAIPTPFDQADRAAGYWWELSMRQVEVSRTLVFDQPRRARAFFEALVADNLDLGP